MKKNVIFWVGIVNPAHKDKYGDYDYFEYSKNTWKYFCKKNNCHFVEFSTPVEKDLTKFRVNWQKAIFVFDELEKRNIKYDQIALVDSSCMYKWDAPNFFKLTKNKFVGWRDIDNMRWVNDSIDGYKSFFKNFKLDRTKYINSGFIIFNASHKEFFNSFKQLYYKNIKEFCNLQDKIVKKGTEQTPLNYWLQINNIEIKTDLPIAFKLTHLHRKEMFGYNWQLNESKIPYFIKYGYNWIFNGLPKNDRSNIMKQVWDIVKLNYTENILDKVVHKDTHKFTTSRKFKEDILNYFNKGFKNKTLIELGCCQGTTTRIYAECFKKVIGVDLDKWNIEQAKNNCTDVTNVEFLQQDLYSEEWEFPKADVVVIDAGHTYDHVIRDIPKVIKYFNNPIIIIDDYGNPKQEIYKAINELESQGILKINKKIGENKGYTTATGLVFNNKEGVICNV